ncbi:hypothetical protein ABNN70_11155 [Sporolactobacillus sp. Y61]|uniref:DUF2721 domain-containing protein n=1 Tax=Sporolactobacillus sp. Y61 TaxID=3160863 RepID=A0AAU8IDD6_9BACL|nr:hypothetical protein [Sporolactobacillus sp. THM19-2]RYL93294.1 hypothetical protein EWH91_05475 [Sporolactobacillus sp. THM19-2]
MDQLIIATSIVCLAGLCFLISKLNQLWIVYRFKHHRKRYIRSLRGSFSIKAAHLYLYSIYLFANAKTDVNLRMRIIRREMDKADFLFLPVNEHKDYTRIDYLEDRLRRQLNQAKRTIFPFAAVVLSAIAVVIASLRSPDSLPDAFETAILTVLIILISVCLVQYAIMNRRQKVLSIIVDMRKLQN